MSRFDKFNDMINMDALNKQIEEARNNDVNYREVVAGEYSCRLEKLELRETKDGRPMLSAQFRIFDDAKFNNNCLFFNRVLIGTKNDGLMIHGANEFLRSIEPYEEEISFENFDQYEELISQVFDDTQGTEYIVDYKPDEFNSFKIEIN